MKRFVGTGTDRALSSPSELLSTAAASATWVQGSGTVSHGWTMLQALTPGTRAVIADRESMEVPRAAALTFKPVFKGSSVIFPCLPPCHPNTGSEVTTRRVKRALNYSQVYHISIPPFYLNLGLKILLKSFHVKWGNGWL